MRLSTHPMLLTARFLLEIVALLAFGRFGAELGTGTVRFVAMVALPAAAATAWGTFAVPGDPSRSGRAPIPIPGRARLALELVFFAGASLAWAASGNRVAGVWLAVATLGLYALSRDRIDWLLAH